MKNLLLIISLLPFASFGQGDYQKGFVVMANGDTVVGLVDLRIKRINSKNVYFKKTRNERTAKYGVGEVLAFGIINGEQYAAIQVRKNSNPEENVFAKVLAWGDAKLYQYKETFYVKTDSIYKIPKKEDKIVASKGVFRHADNRFKNLLNFILYGCNISVDDVKYTQESITDLVNKYNLCRNANYQGLQPHDTKIKVNVGFFSSFTSSTFKRNYELLLGSGNSVNVKEIENTLRPQYGISLGVAIPKISPQVYLTSDFSTRKEAMQFKKQNRNVFFLASINSLNIGLTYSFSPGSNGFYSRAGGLVYFVRNAGYTKIDEAVLSPTEVIVSTETTSLHGIGPYAGQWLATGYTGRIFKNLEFFTEVKLDFVDLYLTEVTIEELTNVQTGNIYNLKRKYSSLCFSFGVRI